jgi:N-acetylglutamate synthase-like GNAT family acetyltransferase
MENWQNTAYTIREAGAAGSASLHDLLAQIGLSSHAVLAPGTRYWLGENEAGAVIGVVGLEYEADAVLLRSAGVLPSHQGCGLGTALTNHALDAARASGATRAYLFSTGAGAYWTRLGFREVPVPELVAALPNAPQVRQYAQLGRLPTEVAWRLDLVGTGGNWWELVRTRRNL